MDALELAQRAVRAAEGDEALALVNRERSGQARFAGSEVHQPTLIENEVIELQIVRDGRLGLAASNRTDDDALKFCPFTMRESGPAVVAAGDNEVITGCDDCAATT